MSPKKTLTKIQQYRLKVLLKDFIDGKEPNIIIRNRNREYRRGNCANALIKNPEVNGVGGSGMLL